MAIFYVAVTRNIVILRVSLLVDFINKRIIASIKSAEVLPVKKSLGKITDI